MQAHVFLVYVSLSTDITGQWKERSALIKCPTLHPYTHAVRIKIDFHFLNMKESIYTGHCNQRGLYTDGTSAEALKMWQTRF